jgi:hypothetical protein
VLAGVVLLLFGYHRVVRALSGVVDRFFIDSDALSGEGVIRLGRLLADTGLLIELSRLNVVKRRGKVHIDVCFDDADSVVLIFGLDFEDVNFELFAENFDGDGVFLMETSKISELILQNRFGVVKFDELGLMGLKFDHMANVSVLLLEISDQGDSGGASRLWEFQHFEHPSGNVAQSFLGHELEHSAVGHLGAIFQAEDQGIFVFGGKERV